VAQKPKTTPRAVLAKNRELQAVQLRSSGASYNQIKETLGYTQKSSAYKAVVRGIRRMAEQEPESVEMAKQLSINRLDEITLALWPTARRGDPNSIDRILRVEARRAALLGLDAPKTFEAKLQIDIFSYNQALRDFVDLFRDVFGEHEDAPKVIDAIDKLGDERYGDIG